MCIADGKPRQRARFGAGMFSGVCFHAGIGGGRAEFDELPRHGPQVARSHEALVQLDGAGRGGLLSRAVALLPRRLLPAPRSGRRSFFLAWSGTAALLRGLVRRRRGVLRRQSSTLQQQQRTQKGRSKAGWPDSDTSFT